MKLKTALSLLAVATVTGVGVKLLLTQPPSKTVESNELVNAPSLSEGLKIAYIESLHSRIRTKTLRAPIRRLVDSLGDPNDPVVKLLTFQVTLNQFEKDFNASERKNLNEYLGAELRKHTAAVLAAIEKALSEVGDEAEAIEQRRALYSLTDQIYATENEKIQTSALLDIAQFSVGDPTPESQLQAGLAIRAFFNTAGDDAEATMNKFKRVLGNSLKASSLRLYEEAFRKRYPQFKGDF